MSGTMKSARHFALRAAAVGAQVGIVAGAFGCNRSGDDTSGAARSGATNASIRTAPAPTGWIPAVNPGARIRPRAKQGVPRGPAAVAAGAAAPPASRANTAELDGDRRGGHGAAPDGRPFFREYADRSAPAFVPGGERAPHGAGDAVNIEVVPGHVLRPLPRTLFGNNAAVWDGGNLQSLDLFDRLKAVNVSLLRFPGGSTSDTYHWDNSYPPYAVAQHWDQMSQPWAASTAEYMYVVRRLGAIPLLTANYGYATYDTTATDGSPANAARLAADWVEYCNAPNDGSNPNGGTDWAAQRALDGSPEPFAVRYWEIGNETFGSWEVGYDPDGSAYAENFKTIADAMKAVDPTISIGLVAQVDAPGQPWTATVLSHPGTIDRADFLIVHDYFEYIVDPSQLSATALLAQASQVGERKAWLDDLVAANTTKPPGAIPYYLGEYNGTIPDNPMQVSLVNGLFISKVLGELATTGWAAASIWDVLNGYDTSSGLGAGDLGFLTASQPGVPDFTPRPSYYPFYFYTRNFGDHLVEVASTDPDVTAYASTWSDGGTGVVVVNEATSSKRVTFSLEGGRAAGRANAWILSGDSLAATQVTLDGQAASTLVGGPLPEAVSPYWVPESPDGTFVVTLPPGSVGSVVLF
jgi:hypothetical protein